MAYKVITYKGQTETQENFTFIQDAFKYMGDLNGQVDRCILDDGEKTLHDLTRDENGQLSSSG